MKKILCLLIICCCIPFYVFASTDTCVRTSDNLMVPDKVEYKDSMEYYVMSTVCVNASEKVYDFADLFSLDEELSLYNSINSFIEKTGYDMAIVTVNYNNKESAMEYADDFYDYNDFSKNGILFLIDMDTREYYISTSGEVIFYFDDYRIESVLDVLEYDIGSGNYIGAANSFVDEVIYYNDLGIVTSKYAIDKNGKIVRKTPWLLFIIISLVVGVIVTLILKGRNKKIKISKDADKYLNGDLKVTRREDRFLFRDTKRIYSPISSSSGGSGGGFSSHSGSSGISHGGGGRKF